MKLRYIGKGESFKELGGRRLESDEIVLIRNEHIAKALLKTLRWEKATIKKRTPKKSEEKKPAEKKINMGEPKLPDKPEKAIPAEENKGVENG